MYLLIYKYVCAMAILKENSMIWSIECIQLCVYMCVCVRMFIDYTIYVTKST